MNDANTKDLIKALVIKKMIDTGLFETKQLGVIKSIEDYAEKNVLPAFFTYFTNNEDSIAFGMNGLIILNLVKTVANVVDETLQDSDMNEITQSIYSVYTDGVKQAVALAGFTGHEIH